MKSHVAPYATAVRCLRVECRGGLVVRLAAYPFDLVMSNGAVYQSAAGMSASSFSAETGFAASVVDIEGFIGFCGITRDALASGVFDGALAYAFMTDFLNPVEDEQEIVSSICGKTTIEDDRYRIEEMALIDLLNQTAGESISPSCRNVFGGQEYGGCKINLAAITVTGTLTHVSGPLVIRDSARAEGADNFGFGSIRFTSGANAGLADIRIDAHAADGTLTLAQAPYYPLAVGDTYELEPGCRRRLIDCQRHGNVRRMKAFLYVPTSSTYTKIGGT